MMPAARGATVVVAPEPEPTNRVVPSAQIWGEERTCRGKVTKKRALAMGILAIAAALVIALAVGLNNSSARSSNTVYGQDYDPLAVGCYADARRDRVLRMRLSDENLTPAVCNAHCESEGFAYYGLQWGIECWCGDADTELDRHGPGICDYECRGDDSFICGGYLANLVYEVGVEAGSSDPAPTPVGDSSCAESPLATVRFATETAYFETGGCATLTHMYEQQSSSSEGPLYVLDEDDNVVEGGSPTGRWLLARDLRVVDGVTLYLHGTAIGGDCDVLRIRSNGPDEFHELRAHGGSFSFISTKVTSWDTENGEQQKEHEGGRSFVNCISEFLGDDDCSKNNMGECRMDIIDSEMGDMGWFDSESYGLTWKVRGLCTDLSNLDVFDRVNVYGDIKNSDIYGMYYGMYSYGHEGGVWTDNQMHDNYQYGFDPHDDSDNLVIANNEVYNNVNHGIIASKRCNNVEIYGNTVYDGGEDAVGIFLHRSSNSAKVYDNHIYNMGDAGIAIMEAFDNEIYDNVIEDVRYGLRISLGGADNYIHDNSFDTCEKYGFFTYEGSDPADASPDGLPARNVFENNKILSTSIGVKIGDGVDNEFIDNYWTGTEELEFRDTSGTVWTGNSLPSDACYKNDNSEFTSDSDVPPEC